MIQNKKQKIAVIIPVYNEEESLPKVLDAIPSKIIDEVVVVNNGSTDRSGEIAQDHRATVLLEEKRGYGAACLKGISYLKSTNPPQIVIFLDGDYSDYPEEMEKLIEKIDEGYDFVLGSRIMGIQSYGAKLSGHSTMGNKLAAFFLKWLFRGRYSDLGPFRAIRFDKLLSLNMADKNYGWTMEMQIKAVRNKLKICEIPVHYRDRFGGISKVTGNFKGSVKAFLKITVTVVLYFFKIKK